ncbi:hypothetical protein [Helicobacter sp. T3_23-1056]
MSLRDFLEGFFGDFEAFLPRILDFFCGLFVGLGILGAVVGFVIFQAVFEATFLSVLLALIIFCVFAFFALVAKSLCVLLKQPKT